MRRSDAAMHSIAEWMIFVAVIKYALTTYLRTLFSCALPSQKETKQAQSIAIERRPAGRPVGERPTRGGMRGAGEDGSSICDPPHVDILQVAYIPVRFHTQM